MNKFTKILSVITALCVLFTTGFVTYTIGVVKTRNLNNEFEEYKEVAQTVEPTPETETAVEPAPVVEPDPEPEPIPEPEPVVTEKPVMESEPESYFEEEPAPERSIYYSIVDLPEYIGKDPRYADLLKCDYYSTGMETIEVITNADSMEVYLNYTEYYIYVYKDDYGVMYGKMCDYSGNVIIDNLISR